MALPAGQRELLELRTGYGVARALGPRATAARLHVALARLARLEARAVRELSDAVRTHDCTATSDAVGRTMAFIGAGFGGGQGQAAGAVEAVRYESVPAGPKPRPRPSSTLGRILGADIPPVASGVILVLLLLGVLGMAVTLLMADAAGQGPRHELWRQRVVNRLRSLR